MFGCNIDEILVLFFEIGTLSFLSLLMKKIKKKLKIESLYSAQQYACIDELMDPEVNTVSYFLVSILN